MNGLPPTSPKRSLFQAIKLVFVTSTLLNESAFDLD